jgi:hypothetical protein
MNLFWLVVSVGIIVGLFALARAVEPHWCSPDATSFTCRVQSLDPTGQTPARWHDARAFVEGERLAITRKVVLRYENEGAPREVLARSERGPRGKAVFVLDGDPLMAVRVPASSKAVARLASMVREPLA